MAVRIVRLGSPREDGEGLRIGTVRRPPRGVPRERFASQDWYDVWYPELAPSAPLVSQALNAATAIGDDTLQKRSQGYVVPDSFTHGTSEQRQTWFRRGFETGDFGACDTMDGAI